MRRLVRRIRFGERVIPAGRVRAGDRVLDLRGWKRVTDVERHKVGVVIHYSRRPTMASVRYAHAAAPMLVRRRST